MTNKTTKLLLLGKNIKYYRKQKGLSQNALADILNISREHLAKIETAKRCISLGLLFEIAQALDIKEQDLLNFER